MKRKFLLTVAMSALFASAQLAFLAPVSAHPAAHVRLSVSSHSAIIRGGRVESSVSSQKVLILGNSEGLQDIRDLEKFVNANVQSIESFASFA